MERQPGSLQPAQPPSTSGLRRMARREKTPQNSGKPGLCQHLARENSLAKSTSVSTILESLAGMEKRLSCRGNCRLLSRTFPVAFVSLPFNCWSPRTAEGLNDEDCPLRSALNGCSATLPGTPHSRRRLPEHARAATVAIEIRRSRWPEGEFGRSPCSTPVLLEAFL